MRMISAQPGRVNRLKVSESIDSRTKNIDYFIFILGCVLGKGSLCWCTLFDISKIYTMMQVVIPNRKDFHTFSSEMFRSLNHRTRCKCLSLRCLSLRWCCFTPPGLSKDIRYHGRHLSSPTLQITRSDMQCQSTSTVDSQHGDYKSLI